MEKCWKMSSAAGPIKKPSKGAGKEKEVTSWEKEAKKPLATVKWGINKCPEAREGAGERNANNDANFRKNNRRRSLVSLANALFKYGTRQEGGDEDCAINKRAATNTGFPARRLHFERGGAKSDRRKKQKKKESADSGDRKTGGKRETIETTQTTVTQDYSGHPSIRRSHKKTLQNGRRNYDVRGGRGRDLITSAQLTQGDTIGTGQRRYTL